MKSILSIVFFLSFSSFILAQDNHRRRVCDESEEVGREYLIQTIDTTANTNEYLEIIPPKFEKYMLRTSEEAFQEKISPYLNPNLIAVQIQPETNTFSVKSYLQKDCNKNKIPDWSIKVLVVEQPARYISLKRNQIINGIDTTYTLPDQEVEFYRKIEDGEIRFISESEAKLSKNEIYSIQGQGISEWKIWICGCRNGGLSRAKENLKRLGYDVDKDFNGSFRAALI